MRLQVGKCYILTHKGVTKKFRVVRYDSNGNLSIRICETNEVEDFYRDTLRGGFYEDFYIQEFDCMECDGQPSL
jgi:hypothetical protein